MSNKFLRGPREAVAFVSRMVKMPTFEQLKAIDSDNPEMRELVGALKVAALRAEVVRNERRERKTGQTAARREKKNSSTATFSRILRGRQASNRTTRQRCAIRRGHMQPAA